MSNATRFAAAFTLAGAMLAPASNSLAQEMIGQTPVYLDYYNTTARPVAGNGAYAAIGPVGTSAAYAAVNGVAAPAIYPGVAQLWPTLRGPDWTGVHGAQP